MINRIDALFSRLRAENHRALMPFLTAGDPDLATTAQAIHEFVTQGADLIEIGIPYSDPIADGPVITSSYHRALQNGIKVSQIFQTIRTLRAEQSARVDRTPLVTMVSFAIIHRYGLDRFLTDMAASGLDGLIVPDLPVEESAALLEQATARGLALIQLITPTTPRERALRIAATTSGFIYYVSVAGITGERAGLPAELTEAVTWLRSHTQLPICIGFGINSAAQARDLAPLCDGVIIGSAVVRRMAGALNRPRGEVVREIGQYLGEIARALDPTEG